MAKKNIEIEELRVSSDGSAIEFAFNCPSEYYFTDFIIEVVGSDKQFSLADALFKDADGNYLIGTTRFVDAVLLSELGVTEPSIFRVTIKAELIEEQEQECDCGDFPETLEKEAYISDVSNVYKCLIDDIIALDSRCLDEDVQNRVIRNYLMLYAHQEALKLKLIDEAEKWFSYIKTCFNNCGHPDRNGADCGCSNQAPAPAPSNCGCGR